MIRVWQVQGTILDHTGPYRTIPWTLYHSRKELVLDGDMCKINIVCGEGSPHVRNPIKDISGSW